MSGSSSPAWSACRGRARSSRSETWAEPAGGGAVAAVRLAELAGSAAFLTALGDDELGRRSRELLAGYGVQVHAAARAEPTRRGFTFVDRSGERTITLIGEKLHPSAAERLPWDELAGSTPSTSPPATRGRSARCARILVATARKLPTLREA